MMDERYINDLTILGSPQETRHYDRSFVVVRLAINSWL